jgi:predicted phosphoribosyltransferase
MLERYEDRTQAGHVLAQLLHRHRRPGNTLVLALPRGGVPVADPIAASLHAPLDVLVVRKLGVPGHEELALGAIASGQTRVINRDIVAALHIDPQVIEQVALREAQELRRREIAFRGERRFPPITGKTVIIVDDGLATGATMRAGVEALRQRRPARLIVAVPVAPPETCQDLAMLVEDLVCPLQPPDFGGVGRWYQKFPQLDDEEVRLILGAAWKRQEAPVA